ncbi:MAG: CBS domain-containing protein [Gemmatimonadetes bacterium]|uniref:CBS domain-containing protein n=1 Tax=Candidatus Kutchimonas denitrificans TaxID=3056748 RepID=A0AAE4ZB66_9BACT|nr:CBS domain-containing protein [Gemmatimonadota bacterium]NIR74215.1 CBS domain-containing protein [Candidatus Kutchimonas denitrificans]NIR99837.1 CBS domain-containing protein [Gemmatimonadota bacterium]NIT65426.1 CBS domain-containing protein [Gemmatimonadota bacterium]NIU51791.1 CBS domain-containing protein [Gemmatimonadota bacterium]
MTREVKSQPSRATVQQAPRYMLDSGIHRVLVMDERELRGIVTTTDIVRAIADGSVQT